VAGNTVLGETVLRIWDMDKSLVSIQGFGSVIPVPVNCRSNMFHVTEWNVVCAGVIRVLVPPILCELVLIFVRGLFFFCVVAAFMFVIVIYYYYYYYYVDHLICNICTCLATGGSALNGTKNMKRNYLNFISQLQKME